MLSYRHSFHAGNFADIIKHVVLVEILEYLSRKDKPFEYIDTHAGAGLYNLNSEHARKLGEHREGIDKLSTEAFPELASYFAAIAQFNPSNNKKAGPFYPGSPLIAAHFLRRQDRGWLYELHPQDFATLSQNIRPYRKIRASCSDGLKGMNGNMPPTSRRGLVLIDPPYEVKTEYEQAYKAIEKAYRKFTSGIFALWYPVVDRTVINRLENNFRGSGIRNIQLFELGLQADTEGHGMTSSGMIVVNPPWQLQQTMTELLPKLAQTLGGEQGCYRCETLVEE